MSYESLQSQPSRLGEFSNFGGEASAIVGQISNTVASIVGTIATTGRDIKISKDGRIVAVHTATESTKKLDISTKGASEMARLDVQRVKATYGSLTKLIVGGGAVFATLLLAGAFAYSIAKGDGDAYEYEYVS
jgi:hypothetical protein